MLPLAFPLGCSEGRLQRWSLHRSSAGHFCRQGKGRFCRAGGPAPEAENASCPTRGGSLGQRSAWHRGCLFWWVSPVAWRGTHLRFGGPAKECFEVAQVRRKGVYGTKNRGDFSSTQVLHFYQKAWDVPAGSPDILRTAPLFASRALDSTRGPRASRPQRGAVVKRRAEGSGELPKAASGEIERLVRSCGSHRGRRWLSSSTLLFQGRNKRRPRKGCQGRVEAAATTGLVRAASRLSGLRPRRAGLVPATPPRPRPPRGAGAQGPTPRGRAIRQSRDRPPSSHSRAVALGQRRPAGPRCCGAARRRPSPRWRRDPGMPACLAGRLPLCGSRLLVPRRSGADTRSRAQRQNTPHARLAASSARVDRHVVLARHGFDAPGSGCSFPGLCSESSLRASASQPTGRLPES